MPMQPLPHEYTVNLTDEGADSLSLTTHGAPQLITAPPAEFGGPGDCWSPETLFVASIADCLALTFRAIARASKFDYNSFNCTAQGLLERVEGKTLFTRISLTVDLVVASDMKEATATRLVEKAENNCLISNSVMCEITLETNISHADR